jgi:hypothetical protein
LLGVRRGISFSERWSGLPTLVISLPRDGLGSEADIVKGEALDFPMEMWPYIRKFEPFGNCFGSAAGSCGDLVEGVGEALGTWHSGVLGFGRICVFYKILNKNIC